MPRVASLKTGFEMKLSDHAARPAGLNSIGYALTAELMSETRYPCFWSWRPSPLPAYFPSTAGHDLAPFTEGQIIIEGTRVTFSVDCGIQYKLYLPKKSVGSTKGMVRGSCITGIDICCRLSTEKHAKGKNSVHGGGLRFRAVCH
jgi:hypothetical protein